MRRERPLEHLSRLEPVGIPVNAAEQPASRIAAGCTPLAVRAHGVLKQAAKAGASWS